MADFAGQTTPRFVQAMQWRMAFGVMMTACMRGFAVILNPRTNTSYTRSEESVRMAS